MLPAPKPQLPPPHKQVVVLKRTNVRPVVVRLPNRNRRPLVRLRQTLRQKLRLKLVPLKKRLLKRQNRQVPLWVGRKRRCPHPVTVQKKLRLTKRPRPVTQNLLRPLLHPRKHPPVRPLQRRQLHIRRRQVVVQRRLPQLLPPKRARQRRLLPLLKRQRLHVRVRRVPSQKLPTRPQLPMKVQQPRVVPQPKEKSAANCRPSTSRLCWSCRH